ncbi:MAG: hypothetical protein R2878_02330 [Thermoleophilia bacterium]
MEQHQPVGVALADVARGAGIVGAFAAIAALILTWFPADITRTSAIHEDLVTTESRIAGSVLVLMWPLGLAAGILAAVLGLVALGRSIDHPRRYRAAEVALLLSLGALVVSFLTALRVVAVIPST